MKRFEFHLHLTKDQCLEYYRGVAKNVIVRSKTGQNVQFPASFIQKFVTQDGINGDFTLICDDEFKNARLEKIA